MAKKPVKAKNGKAITVVERTVQAIRDAIKRGRYVAGQRLIEADLTKQLGVSRGPLREALWRLSGEGLLTIEPNRGVSVKELTREEALDIYAIREMLEGLAARLAAHQIKKGNNLKLLKAAKDLAEKHERDTDISKYMAANESFHDTIVALSGNEQLGDLIAQLRLPLFRLQFTQIFRDQKATSQSVSEHKDIYNAIREGDATRAERAMRRHIRHSSEILKTLPGLDLA